MNKISTDIAIIGGGIGGVMAAYQALKQGHKVVLTERYDWLGGQFTSQGVPADEHAYIETVGRTQSYAAYRNSIRNTFLNEKNINPQCLSNPLINPGESWVSAIGHDPRYSVDYFNALLAPFIETKQLILLKPYVLTHVHVQDDEVKSVVLTHKELTVDLHASLFLDATETGEMLPLGNIEYVTGSESFEETNEPSAPLVADAEDIQSVTWVCALAYDTTHFSVIDKPKHYDYFKSITCDFMEHKPLLSWYGPDGEFRGKPRLFGMFGWPKTSEGRVIPCLFPYRRVIYGQHFSPPVADVSLINWPQNDYFLGNLYESHDSEHHAYMAKELTRSLVYWLQTEAPRHDGGVGYKELRLMSDVLGTQDGFAQAPYIRESRRIKALTTIKETDVSVAHNKEPIMIHDSVGIGLYKLDVHVTTKTHTTRYDAAWPFQIPLGALIPIRVKNVIASCKNIGSTHITNACFRLHPVEWNIGEAAGLLASYCLVNAILPKTVHEQVRHLRSYQDLLEKEGIELVWPTDVLRHFKK